METGSGHLHIREIRIQGWKSYLNQPTMEILDPHCNVIVGRNGAGKSNFFSAVELLLSDKYQKLSSEKRKALIHDGPRLDQGQGATVEIIFDNSSGRIPRATPLVSLKRVIRLQGDDFQINNRTASYQDVKALLETAGFSSSNPFYIVQQGRVSALTAMSDSQRLDLLKEVAGTRVYDEKREQTMRTLQDAGTKTLTFSEALAVLESRIDELQLEQEEYVQYQDLDRKRRAMEYTVYNRSLEEVKEKLDEIEEERMQELGRFEDMEVDKEQARERVKEMERTLRTVNVAIQGKSRERDELGPQRDTVLREITDVEVSLSATQILLQHSERVREVDEQLAVVRTQIGVVEEELQQVIPEEEAKRKEYQELEAQLVLLHQQQQDLYSKKGATEEYASKAERDDALGQQLQNIDVHLSSLLEQRRDLDEEVQKCRAAIEAGEAAARETSRAVQSRREELDTLRDRYSEAKRLRDDAQEARRLVWAESNDREREFEAVEREKAHMEKEFSGMMPSDVNMGMHSIQKIVEEHQIAGVYGPLIELIALPENGFDTAVEVIAGNRLFHIVVKDSEVAAELLEIMNQTESPGRVTFMPLDDLRVSPRELPTTKEAFPLISKIQYHQNFEKAVQLVFGKVLVARSMDAALAASREFGTDAVTLDGDCFSRKGSVTGGFQDGRRKRLATMKKVKELRRRHGELQELITNIRNSRDEVTQRVNEQVRAMQAAEDELAKVKGSLEELKKSLVTKEMEVRALEKTMKDKVAMLEAFNRAFEEESATKARVQSRLNVDFDKELSPEEEQELLHLSRDISALQSRQPALKKQFVEVEGRRLELESQLAENLSKQLEELMEEREELLSSQEDRVHKLEKLQSLLEEKQALLRDRETQLNALNEEIAALQRQKQDLEEDLERYRAQEDRSQNRSGSEAAAVKRLDAKKQRLLERKSELVQSIIDVGGVQSNQDYQNVSTSKLKDKLQKVKRALHAFTAVNKKSLDHLQRFMQRRDELLSRRDELSSGSTSIEDLIQLLDMRKDEKIELTFKQVASHFENIFRTLVPGGSASLVMKRNEELLGDGASSSAPSGSSSRVETWSGVSIKAKFPGTVESGSLSLMSGGQNTVLSLALIFAIQRCDPAPFYLFDEVDSALDPVYREAVARMMHDLSRSEDNPCQFITISFKPEMIRYADKHFGVTCHNKVSSINVISEEDALEILRINERSSRKSTSSVATRRDSRGTHAPETEETGADEDQEDMAPADAHTSSPIR